MIAINPEKGYECVVSRSGKLSKFEIDLVKNDFRTATRFNDDSYKS